MTDENLTTEERNDIDDSVVEESATVAVTQQPVDKVMLRKIVEGAILAAAQPMTVARILELFDEAVAPVSDKAGRNGQDRLGPDPMHGIWLIVAGIIHQSEFKEIIQTASRIVPEYPPFYIFII